MTNQPPEEDPVGADDPVVEETSPEDERSIPETAARDGGQDVPAGAPLAVMNSEEPDLPMPGVLVETEEQP